MSRVALLLYHISKKNFFYVLSSCEFGGKACEEDAFRVLYTDFGGCFIFNWDQKKPLVADDIGSNFGLKVTINLEQYEYMPGKELTMNWGRNLVLSPRNVEVRGLH